VGGVDGSEASYNVLAGSGSSALDTRRSHGDIASTTNNTDGWHDTTGWVVIFKKLLQPMTALWSALAVLIVVSAIRGRRGDRPIEHPYARQAATFDAVPASPPLVIDLDRPGHPFDAGWASADERIAARTRAVRSGGSTGGAT